MTPQEIVHELNKHIVGQMKAKRAVAIALRNRWRRQQVADPLRQEITPKNILMIGPTGRGQDRDRAAPGQARRRALREGRGDQVHRGRLRRPRRGHHHPRPGGDGHQAEPRAGDPQGDGARAGRRRGARARRAAAAGPRVRACRTSRARRRTPRARSSARSCAKASWTTRTSRSRWRRCSRRWRSSPRPAWRSSPRRSSPCSRTSAAGAASCAR